MPVRVILKKSIVGLGIEGEIVKVSRGYARNYLFPKDLVMEENPNNLRILEKHKDKIEQRKQEEIAKNQVLIEKIESNPIEIEMKVVEGNKLYGSVSAKEIVSLLLEKEIEVHKQNIEMPGVIKTTGEYEIPIRMTLGCQAMLKVSIHSQKE